MSLNVGDYVVLDIAQASAIGANGSILITGRIMAQRPHFDNPKRMQFFFGCHKVCIQQGNVVSTAATLPVSKLTKNELQSRSAHIVSDQGYVYRPDGWYDDTFLLPILQPAAKGSELVSIPESAMNTYCEIRYLCFSFRPWFAVDFTILGTVSPPESIWAYSAHVCHRCLQVFFSIDDLEQHLNCFCQQRHQPGEVIYTKKALIGPLRTGEVHTRYVDGAIHQQYCRRLALLTKGFVESKVLINDVDIYEFFVVTVSRSTVMALARSENKEACDSYDTEKWNGDLVVGYFCRIKHHADHSLACLSVFPPFQGLGVGGFLIALSYHLTFVRQTECGCADYCGRGGGTVSRPWSYMGQQALFSYWRQAVSKIIAKFDGQEVDSIETFAKSIPGVHADDLCRYFVARRNLFYETMKSQGPVGGASRSRGIDSYVPADAYQGANTAPAPLPKETVGYLFFDGDEDDTEAERPPTATNSSDIAVRSLMRFDETCLFISRYKYHYALKTA